MTQPIELKGSVMSFTVLKVHSDDIGQVQHALAEKVQQAPGFFQNVPVVIEPTVTALPPTFLAQLMEILRQNGMMPIGLRTQDEAIRQQAEFAGLGIFDIETGKRARAERAKREKGESCAAAPGKLVLKTIRSGQQVYAKNRDLVIIGSVNPGAEVYADGHIHVYGALKGRAFAGAQGDETARIFVSRLEAELVCIAGLYILAEDIPPAIRGKAVTAFLQNEKVEFSELP
ncbi:septum site-determining protein MinC [Sulfurivirga caldicuralii]|uniref:Probable septum site-determining protein MinC n=1 Tax=Sulfurivirga caldicuralii TaxID=364032 RepID=A0A1N6F7J0_9GAMM|nr:septum site-determining protein MinC [Sulfurivirga caldicuralii]SIN91164.1 septum site-determining protein MinC [Sulfurivirga caldicuralii]